MRIGVLALQGAFIEHERMLAELGAESFEIRQLRDIGRSMDGLIIPGGESTVQGKLLRELGLFEPIRDMILSGMPVFGTCAGLILLAKRIDGGEPPHLAVMDITAKRNAYGRQLGSFSANADFKGIGNVPMTFIRAPYISASDGAEILAEVDGKAVAARQGNMLVTAFHPELTQDLSVHKYFIEMASQYALKLAQ
ncbi:MAG: pyridoxal 5'-phosphate synthase glutaminase subunit PdxT [Oscillospiraceae bacterium]